MKYGFIWALPLVLAACGKHDPAAHDHEKKVAAPSDKAKDPVCGMAVTPSTAKKAEFDKADYFFCSGECVKKFQAEPAKYGKACTCAKSMGKCDCDHCSGKRLPCDCPD